MAYAEDTRGNEIYTVYVIDAETGAHVGKPLVNVTSFLEWAGNEALAYITMDNTLRPDKVWYFYLNPLFLMTWLVSHSYLTCFEVFGQDI